MRTSAQQVESRATAKVNARVRRLTLRFAVASVVEAVRRERPDGLEGEEERLVLVGHRTKSLWHGVEEEGGRRESRYSSARAVEVEPCAVGDPEELWKSRRVSRGEVAQVGQLSRISCAVEGVRVQQAQQVQAQRVSVGETEGGCSSLRSIRMRRS